MDIRTYNREAWNKAVERTNAWTIPVESKVIDAARMDDWSVNLTPSKPVPRCWFPDLNGLEILGLGAGGGQQGPIFAAAGATVTVLDNSPMQLEQDRLVASRDGLKLRLVEGDMKDLRIFGDSSFDLIFNPVSVCFTDDVLSVWHECFRVLRPGGILMTGFLNPTVYMFDKSLENKKILQVRYPLPYSDLTSLNDDERARYTSYQAPLEFSHTLGDLIGGQLAVGFNLTGLLEADWGGEDFLDKYMKAFIATRAVKPIGSHKDQT